MGSTAVNNISPVEVKDKATFTVKLSGLDVLYRELAVTDNAESCGDKHSFILKLFIEWGISIEVFISISLSPKLFIL